MSTSLDQKWSHLSRANLTSAIANTQICWTQISPSTMSPTPVPFFGNWPSDISQFTSHSYISTDNYDHYLAPYLSSLKPVHRAIPRTVPFLETPKDRQVICHYIRTLGFTSDHLIEFGATATWLHHTEHPPGRPVSLWFCRCFAMAAWSPRFVCPFCECCSETSRCILAENLTLSDFLWPPNLW